MKRPHVVSDSRVEDKSSSPLCAPAPKLLSQSNNSYERNLQMRSEGLPYLLKLLLQ